MTQTATELLYQSPHLELKDDKKQLCRQLFSIREENPAVKPINQSDLLHSAEGKNDEKTIVIKVSETFKRYPEQERNHLIKYLCGKEGADYILIKKTLINKEPVFKIVVIKKTEKRPRPKSNNQDHLMTDSQTKIVPDIQPKDSPESSLNFKDGNSRSAKDDSQVSVVAIESTDLLKNTNYINFLRATTTVLKVLMACMSDMPYYLEMEL